MENRDINVFIISYNRLTYLKKLVDWLIKAGFEKIHIVDNASTYPPLLEYFKKTKAKVHRLDKNWGHLAVWECGEFDAILKKENYIVSDCDVLPVEECPLEVASYFKNILDRYPEIAKVGFGLRIDDLPEKYVFKKNVLKWEQQFWEKKIEKGLFSASIDTTFALYRPGIYPKNNQWWQSIRTDFPYVAKHLPWYENSEKLSAEDLFYQNSLQDKASFWGVTDEKKLKESYGQLWQELEEVYNSLGWKLLQIFYRILYLFSRKKRFLQRIGRKERVEIQADFDREKIQQNNQEIIKEIGRIKSSEGWQYWERVKGFFKK